jgi:hypothetical protein
VHRSDGGSASLWRIQYVGDGFEIRRAGLFVVVYAGEDGFGEDWGDDEVGVREQKGEAKDLT